MAFQDNAWCDEKMMREWIHQQWKPACSGDMLLALNFHKAQTPDPIQEGLRKDCKTEPVFIPVGTTSLVQPVDIVFNAQFKAAVERKATKHLQENLNSYVKGRINASERRVLFTKWVGAAWEELSSKTEMIVHSFEKCGISVAPEDEKIHINGLEDYNVESDDNEDPFSDEEEGDKDTSGVSAE